MTKYNVLVFNKNQMIKVYDIITSITHKYTTEKRFVETPFFTSEVRDKLEKAKIPHVYFPSFEASNVDEIRLNLYSYFVLRSDVKEKMKMEKPENFEWIYTHVSEKEFDPPLNDLSWLFPDLYK